MPSPNEERYLAANKETTYRPSYDLAQNVNRQVGSKINKGLMGISRIIRGRKKHKKTRLII